MTDWKNIVSLDRLEFEPDASVPESYAYETAPAAFSAKLGAKKLGWNVSVIGPGKFSCPYHYHVSEEELFLVLEGKALLRMPQGFREVVKGELIFFQANDEGAHQFYNHTDKPFRYLALSTLDPLDVCGYPDSDKISVRALKKVFQAGAVVDYWKDEMEPAKYWPATEMHKR